MAAANQLYTDVVQITQDFLGPASERFIERQVKTHIHKDPRELDQNDLKQLSEWLKVAIALLTDDETTVKKYTDNI